MAQQMGLNMGMGFGAGMGFGMGMGLNLGLGGAGLFLPNNNGVAYGQPVFSNSQQPNSFGFDFGTENYHR